MPHFDFDTPKWRFEVKTLQKKMEDGWCMKIPLKVGRWTVGAIVVLLAVGIFARNFRFFTTRKNVVIQPVEYQALTDARNRWTESAIDHYRIALETGIQGCLYVAEVTGEGVKLDPEASTCGAETLFGGVESLTVEEMFDQIEKTLTIQECGSNGCLCDGRVHVNADYDDENGYPISVKRDLVWGTGKPEFQWNIILRRTCTLVGTAYSPLFIRELVSLER